LRHHNFGCLALRGFVKDVRELNRFSKGEHHGRWHQCDLFYPLNLPTEPVTAKNPPLKLPHKQGVLISSR
jgi:hypothetical protein